MGKLIQFEYNDSKIFIEAVDVERSGIREIGVMEEVNKHLEKSMSIIKPFCTALLNNLNELDTKPDIVKAEFGVAFNGSVGAFIAKVGGEASLKVSIEWRK